MAKKITRRKAAQWLAPMRAAFQQMKTGEVDSIRGYAVTKLHHRDDYARIDFCIAGFRALISRLFPDIELSDLEKIERRLAAGVPIAYQDIDCALSILRRVEDSMVGIHQSVVTDAVLTEQIIIEVEQKGMQNELQ